MKAARRRSNQQAQKTLRERRAAEGLKQLNVWAPRSQHPELRTLAKMLRDNPRAVITSVAVQDPATGRMRGLKLR
jgi:hypothetical protein